jgi:Cu/Ag efflux protein CusF
MSNVSIHVRAAVALATLMFCTATLGDTPKPAVRDQLIQRTATVKAIDMPSRLVTLTGQDGDEFSVVVGEEAKNLDQVKVGDKVTLSYYEALAAEVKPKGTGTQGVDTAVSSVSAAKGEKPAGGAGVSMRTTVTIESVDTKANTVTFKRQDGEVRTVNVESPQGQEFIRGLKQGDEVEVTYTEAFAIEVKPAT